MTKEELMQALTTLTPEERKALLGEVKKESTYKVRQTIEITFGGKPDADTRKKLAEAKFHWNSFEKVWYAYATKEAIALVAELGLKQEGK